MTAHLRSVVLVTVFLAFSRPTHHLQRIVVTRFSRNLIQSYVDVGAIIITGAVTLEQAAQERLKGETVVNGRVRTAYLLPVLADKSLLPKRDGTGCAGLYSRATRGKMIGGGAN
ncbi:hypothetical protein BJ170DRAFT_100646 [Xylariales sp. AK1849]|nr:hypothetical protein BJ170DRAFT_100646 [Xylariales sp. AK1849]